MKKTKLALFLLPLILSSCSCSGNNEYHQYQAINDQQSIMKEYYSQHRSNQSYLSKYTYSASLTYDPTYDAFGELAPIDQTIGLFYEYNQKSEINVYSGYFIRKDQEKTYIGNKNNAGSIETREKGKSYWFRKFDEEGHDNEMQLIERTEVKNNDLSNKITDVKTPIAVETSNISNYFANNINTEYEDEFVYPLSQPIASNDIQVSAYKKSESEIVEVYSVTLELPPINNPLQPGEEHKLTVMAKITGETTFKLIDNIGWAATNFEEIATTSLVTDYELKLLESPRVVMSEQKQVTFSYSTSVLPYSGDTFVYQSEDSTAQTQWPSLYNYNNGEFTPSNIEPKNVTIEYKILHPEFSGYVFQFDKVLIEKNKLYSFTTVQDKANEIYDSIGYKEFSKNAGGTLIFGGVEGKNLFTSILDNQTYEFLVLISSTGTKSLIAHLAKQ